MADLQLEITGSGAVAATAALLQTPGLTGNWEAASKEPQREGVLATIATIVAITTGTLTLAEKIYQWYQQRQQAAPAETIDKVMLIGRNGERILLKNAMIEQIRRILET
jgi:hypothetical protein